MPFSKFTVEEKYEYLEGLGSYHQSEAVKGALPVGASCPQKPPYGLFIERISGTSFTAPRAENQQTWLYRVLPSTSKGTFKPYESGTSKYSGLNPGELHHIPNDYSWNNFKTNDDTDWVQSFRMVGQSGSPLSKTGLAYHIFAVTKDMPLNQAYTSSDGDYLIILQDGALDIQTELGNLLVRANEIVVIPRGIRHRVTLPQGPARGYVLELYQGHFQVPELGPIGSCGLANIRDFQIPIANFQHDITTEWTVVTKYNDKMFAATQDHTPFDIVSWHGTYYPYKYDLGRFNTMGSVSYDHPDPSITTVLTAPSDHAGSAVVDFAIFPPRWEVMENTYRAPYYHRNTMSEFVGIVCPQPAIANGASIESSTSTSFSPFGAELINCMVPHGVDRGFHEHSSNAELKPVRIPEGMIRFMWETSLSIGITDWALATCDEPLDVGQTSKDGFKPLFKMPV